MRFFAYDYDYIATKSQFSDEYKACSFELY